MFSSERQLRGVFVLVPALLDVYWLSLGMSVRAVATVTGWLVIQTAFGTLLLQGFAKDRALPTLDSLGLGFACGALSLVVARQVSLFFSIPEWVFLAFMTATIVIHVCRRPPRINRDRRWMIGFTRLPIDSLILICALTGALLGSREFIPISRYLTSLGVLLLGFIVGSGSLKRISSHTSFWLIAAVMATIPVVHLTLGSGSYDSWKQRLLNTGSDDVLFSEAFGFLVDKRGPIVDTQSSSQWMYHWLSLGWSGTMQRLSGLEPLDMSLIVSPSVGYVAIACLGIAILRGFTTLRTLPIITVVVLLLTSSPGFRMTAVFVENTSNVFGLVWLLAAARVLLDRHALDFQAKMPRMIVLGLMTSATALSKAPYAVVLAFVAFAILGDQIYQNIRRHSRERQLRAALLQNKDQIRDFIIVLTACIMTYIVFLRQPAGGTEIFELGLRPLVDYDSHRYLAVFISVFWIIVRGLPVAGLLFPGATRQSFTWKPIFFGALPAICIDLVLNRNDDYYFTNSAVLLAGLPCVYGVSRVLEEMQRNRRALQTLSSGGVLAITLLLLGSRVVGSQTTLVWFLSCALISVCISFVLWQKMRRRLLNGNSLTFARIATIGGLLIACGGYGLDVGELPQRSEIPTTETLHALEEVRRATPNDAVIATNLGLCGYPPCTRTDLERFLVPAIANRTPFVVPLLNTLDKTSPLWLLNGTAKSLNFAASANPDTAVALLGDGATHFLLDSRAEGFGPNRNKIHQYGEILFEDSRFVLIALDQSLQRTAP